MSWHQTKTAIIEKGDVISSKCIEIYINNEIVFIRHNKSYDIPIDIDEFTLLIFSRMKMLNIDKNILNQRKIEETIKNEFIEDNETFKLDTLSLEEHIDNVCNPKDIKGLGSSISLSYHKMDNFNKNATDIMATGNMDKAIEHMFKDQETGKSLTYSEMRSRYG